MAEGTAEMQRGTAKVTWSPVVTGPLSEAGVAGLEEAVVEVPRDHDDPWSPTISLALCRLPAADPVRRRGTLVVIHGGPGGNNGLGRRTPAEFATTALHEVYDLVGIDPRGFGDSTFLPRVKSEETAPFDSRPPDEGFAALTEDMRARERGCVEGGGELRRHVTTRNIVRDLDAVRRALGEERISVLGYAFGTAVGAAYGTVFPEHLDRVVLDSSVNPRWDWRHQFMAQARVITDNTRAWAGWTGDRHATFGLGAGEEAVLATLERLAAGLVELAGGPWLRSVLDGILGNQTADRPRWGELAGLLGEVSDAVAAGDAGVAGEVLRRGNAWRPGDGGFELQEGVLEAVTSESDWPTDLEVYYRDMREYRERHPYGFGVFRAMPWVGTFGGTGDGSSGALPPTAPPIRTENRGGPVGLVVQADGDTLNHREGAETMCSVQGHRLVLVTDSGDHEIYHRSLYPEVDRIVERYLLDGVLPDEAVTRVAGHPRPDVPADGS